MRTTLMCVLLFAHILIFAQHPQWLPVNAEVTYVEASPGFPVSEVEVTHMVAAAYAIDTVDVRIMVGGGCGCSQLPPSTNYRLHRRGNRVFYVDPVDSTLEYDLYDYGASAGDTVRAITSGNGGPDYAVMIVDSVVEEKFGDTTLLVQKLRPFSANGYIDVIVGLFAKSFVFPENQLCDPACAYVSMYRDAETEICFDPRTCFGEELDFPFSPLDPEYTYFMKGQGVEYFGVSHTLDYAPDGGIAFLPPAAFVTGDNEWYCLREDRGGWAYRRVEVYPDTLVRFYNSSNEPIEVYLNRNVGDCWDAYSHDGTVVSACFDRYEYQDINGVTDSIMCITFDGVFGELCISKEFGLSRMPSFQKFPAYEDTWFQYEQQQQFTVIGRQPTWQNIISSSSISLNWYGAMDLTPGDILHVEETLLDYSTGTINQDKLVYIGKRVVQGGTEWLWNRERRQYYDLNDSLFIDSRDTFIQFVSYADLEVGPMTYLPGSAAISQDGATINTGEFFNQRYVKAIPSQFIFREDTCWYEIIVSQSALSPHKWIQGLAGPYYEDFYPPTFYSARVLKYYNKLNSEEWGDPFDFTVSTRHPEQADAWTLFPNPASENITIKSNIDQQVRLDLIATGGELVFSQNANTNQSLTLSTLPTGVYYYRITVDERSQVGKLVLTN